MRYSKSLGQLPATIFWCPFIQNGKLDLNALNPQRIRLTYWKVWRIGITPSLKIIIDSRWKGVYNLDLSICSIQEGACAVHSVQREFKNLQANVQV
jgi:hypothetical protein